MKSLFEQYFGIELADKVEQDIHCIWHDDRRESLSINLESGKFHCHGCGKSGQIQELTAELVQIAETEVDRWHKMLLDEPRLMAWLKTAKGWNDETIKNYKIGHNGGRFTLPVRDAEGGSCINMRLYSATATPKILPYGDGFGKVAWFPYPPTQNTQEVYLMEGESDTLLARQLGFDAYCHTGGAAFWSEDMTKDLAGKKVNVCYDMDSAGRKGASKVINAIKFCVEEIRNVHIPVGTAGKDFSDWIVRGTGVTRDHFLSVVKETAPHVVSGSSITMDDPVAMPLWEIVRASNAHKPVECEVMVVSKSGSPFLIPKKFVVECPANAKMCGSCQNVSGNKAYELDWRDPSFLGMVDIPDDFINSRLKKILDIPLGCKTMRVKVQEFQNIERIGMIPRVDWHVMRQMSSDFAAQSRKGYFVGTGIKSNEGYTVRGVVIPDPADQTAVMMVVEAAPVIDENDAIDLKLCEIFRVGEENDQGKAADVRPGDDGEVLQDLREE